MATRGFNSLRRQYIPRKLQIFSPLGELQIFSLPLFGDFDNQPPFERDYLLFPNFCGKYKYATFEDFRMARKKTGTVSGRFFVKKWTTTESVARGGSFFL